MGAPPRSNVTAEQLIVRVRGVEDAPLVQAFTCGEADLDDFVRTDALRLPAHGVVRCYLAFFGSELVGSMAVLSDAIVLETKERKRLALGPGDHPIVPAVKIARLGVTET